MAIPFVVQGAVSVIPWDRPSLATKDVDELAAHVIDAVRLHFKFSMPKPTRDYNHMWGHQ